MKTFLDWVVSSSWHIISSRCLTIACVRDIIWISFSGILCLHLFYHSWYESVHRTHKWLTASGKINISVINHEGHLIFVFSKRPMHLLQFDALVQSDISSPVVQVSQQRLLPIIQTCNALVVMDQKPHISCIYNCWKTNRMPESEPALRFKNSQIAQLNLSDASVQL